MKSLQKFRVVFILAVCAPFVSTARANLINITNDLASPASWVGDYAMNATDGTGDQTVASWLASEITSYNAYLNPEWDIPPLWVPEARRGGEWRRFSSMA